MMNEDALRLIQQTAIDADHANVFENPEPKALVFVDKNRAAVPLEKYARQRARFRGSMSTSLLSEFVTYNARRNELRTELVTSNGPVPNLDLRRLTRSTIFIDADGFSATAFYNLGDEREPGHGDDTATLTLKPTAGYAELCRIEGKQFDQKAMAEWLEDWRDYLDVAIDEGGNFMPVGAAILAVRKVTIKATSKSTTTVSSFGATQEGMSAIDASAEERLPAFIDFKCTPYLGFGERRIRLRVSVITSEPPKLVLRIVAKEALAEVLATEFKEILIRDVGDKSDLTIGTFKP